MDSLTAPTSDTDKTGRSAIVIGGSMAGLLAARVLADIFDRVTIVERDSFPDEPIFRAGVPQGRHLHVLLRRGQLLLEELFPGLGDELTGAGVPLLDWGKDVYWHSFLGLMPRFQSDFTTYACSRPLLEYLVRKRLATHPAVRFSSSREIVGLLSNANKTRVTGVRIRPRDGERGHHEEAMAELVVDASGRESHTPEWLESLGYARPRETIINAYLGYATRQYRIPPNAAHDWKTILVQSEPPAGKRGAVIYTVEGDRWFVTLGGAAHDYPPTEEASFLAFAQSLPDPTLYDAIKDAEPLTPVYGYRQTANRWRHYEQLARWPEGFVVVGDAVCAFNPVYGQGMTTAALGAETLGRCLREQQRRNSNGALDGMPRRFQRALAKVNQLPWLMATGEDLRFPETEGGKTGPMAILLRRYIDSVRRLAVNDPAVQMQFLYVMHLLKPPTILLRPSLALRAFFQKKSPTEQRGGE